MLDWTGEQWKAFSIGVFWTLSSLVFFVLLQIIARWYLFNKCTFRTFSYFGLRGRRQSELNDSTALSIVPPNKKWRICNEALSLIHSVISGAWAAYALLRYPDLLSDMVNFRCDVAINLLFLSGGYLIHDLSDLLINERSKRILELLFHHFIVLLAFATTLISNKFLGVVICGLLMELNSVFLHSRSLLNLYGVNKKAARFRMVAFLNMTTLCVFRVAVSAYLFYWMVRNFMNMNWLERIPTVLVICSLCVTNSVLAYRVMAADGLLGASRARKNANPGAAGDGNDDNDDEEADTDEAPTAVVIDAETTAAPSSQSDSNGLITTTSVEIHTQPV